MKTKCTCRVAKEGDYDVAKGHVDAGQLIECAGHIALHAIKDKLNEGKHMPKPPRSYEAGDYQGDPAVEAVERLRRTEIRLNRFFRFMGHSQMGHAESPDNVSCFANDGALYATSPAITIGQVSEAAAKNNLSGEVELYVGSHRWGRVLV